MNFVLWNVLTSAEPLRRFELPVMALKHGKTAVTLAQAQNPWPGVLDHVRSLEHHLVHDHADATALGGMANRRIRAVERVLPNHAQKIYCHGRKLAHQAVGVKLARGQALQAQPLLPNALTLAGTKQRPLCRGISRLLAGNGLNRGTTRIPFDDEGDLTLELGRLAGQLLHQFDRAKARISSHQQRACQ